MRPTSAQANQGALPVHTRQSTPTFTRTNNGRPESPPTRRSTPTFTQANNGRAESLPTRRSTPTFAQANNGRATSHPTRRSTPTFAQANTGRAVSVRRRRVTMSTTRGVGGTRSSRSVGHVCVVECRHARTLRVVGVRGVGRTGHVSGRGRRRPAGVPVAVGEHRLLSQRGGGTLRHPRARLAGAGGAPELPTRLRPRASGAAAQPSRVLRVRRRHGPGQRREARLRPLDRARRHPLHVAHLGDHLPQRPGSRLPDQPPVLPPLLAPLGLRRHGRCSWTFGSALATGPESERPSASLHGVRNRARRSGRNPNASRIPAAPPRPRPAAPALPRRARPARGTRPALRRPPRPPPRPPRRAAPGRRAQAGVRPGPPPSRPRRRRPAGRPRDAGATRSRGGRGRARRRASPCAPGRRGRGGPGRRARAGAPCGRRSRSA